MDCLKVTVKDKECLKMGFKIKQSCQAYDPQQYSEGIVRLYHEHKQNNQLSESVTALLKAIVS